MEKVVSRGLQLLYTRKIKFSLREYSLDISKSTVISDQPFIDSAIYFIANVSKNYVKLSNLG